MKTAQAILDRSKNRFESGVVVESDYLSAQVRMATRKQELIRAQNNFALARAQLSTAMGISTDDRIRSGEALAERNLPATITGRSGKASHRDAPRPETHSLGRSGTAAERGDSEIVVRAAHKRVWGWEADNPTFVSGRRREQLASRD